MAARLTLDPDSGLALAFAVVDSSTAPLVLLDGDFKLVAASMSFYETFGLTHSDAEGRSLFDLGSGEWNLPQLRALLRAMAAGDAPVDAYEMDLKGERAEPRRLVISARKLDYGDPEHVRLLLCVADVTDARLADKRKDDLLREKAILLQEIQHRIANSLQIIASVILQSARRVRSEEARGHLRDAHSRVMSVATLQQQLVASRLGEVALLDYFTQLCESIGGSMIRDPGQLVLDVDVDASAVPADTSVSLGLVVTELVINALKHAFPGGRHGRIVVGYHAHGQDWTLSVSDDGVGMPKDAASSRPGLGTSIVAALANQLDARVIVANESPGTTVRLVHGAHASVPADPQSAPETVGRRTAAGRARVKGSQGRRR